MADRESLEFGKLAVALGFLRKEDLEKAIKLQEDLVRVGVQKRLGEVLLEKKVLTREQVLLILRGQGKRILTCRSCQKSYNIHHFRGDEVYACKYCRGELALPNKPVEASVNDSIRVDTTDLRSKRNGHPEKGTAKATRTARPKPPRELVNLLPGYEIQERLGQGGMGAVYKARDLIMGRTVAVKLLAPFLASDDEYVKRFFLEARNCQRLNHPNIVAAYDAGVAGDHKFFIMEFVDGTTLEKVLSKKGMLPEASALEIVRQIAQALDYAWNHKIIHRDVKPQNVMITQSRTVKLCDLGLSKDVTSDVTLTMTGSVNCSPPYASPEQAQGLKELDCRSDVYSLGVTLFQMVCGELPFKGTAPGQFLIQHVTKAPPDPCKVNPKLSGALGRLILKMLSKEAADRPWPGDVARAITKFLNRSDGVGSGK
ncbi:MAG TPA: serine/threonine-protein kinase [Planctomycetota bacterium]|nr:serine/threonine-protein kinase [Planctomycetota bacterium]